ncbi:hypothetical protein LR48_Vigan11g068800 [Vigna angularis]|uniref:Uncharacterized protein n=1 Tax=Phaseolus angularis TaxID=3914 RepID=A0A0L9VRF7_PHAAN|nr:hypothetical protein LR48_Vigan11g068800 [Vigna angularis]
MVFHAQALQKTLKHRASDAQAPQKGTPGVTVVFSAQASQMTPKLRATGAQAPNKGRPSGERHSSTLKPPKRAPKLRAHLPSSKTLKHRASDAQAPQKGTPGVTVVFSAQASQMTPKLRATGAQAPNKGRPSGRPDGEQLFLALKPKKGAHKLRASDAQAPKRGAQAVSDTLLRLRLQKGHPSFEHSSLLRPNLGHPGELARGVVLSAPARVPRRETLLEDWHSASLKGRSGVNARLLR